MFWRWSGIYYPVMMSMGSRSQKLPSDTCYNDNLEKQPSKWLPFLPWTPAEPLSTLEPDPRKGYLYPTPSNSSSGVSGFISYSPQAYLYTKR